MKKRSMVCRLGKFPQLTRTVFTSADGLASDNITALCYGADNCLYVGTDRGLSKIDGKKITTVDIGIETRRYPCSSAQTTGISSSARARA